MKPIIFAYDIEVMPNLVRTWAKYEQNVIWYERYAYVWSISYQILGQKKIIHKNITDFPLYKKDKYSDEALVKYIWEQMSNCDAVLTQNGNSFDNKLLYGRFAKYRLGPPKPFQKIDTKILLKRYLREDSNSLKDVCIKYNLPHKIETGGYELWRQCENGDSRAINEMRLYNNGDIVSLVALYYFLLPFIENHPNLALMNGYRIACPNCASKNIQKRGTYPTRVSFMQRWQCMDCGSWRSSSLKENSQIK